jgi:predicted methyltransferase
MKKYNLILLLEKLEEEKNKYKILKGNCEKIKNKRKVYKEISKRFNLLKRKDEKYYKLCKEITGDKPKRECLKEIKGKLERN